MVSICTNTKCTNTNTKHKYNHDTSHPPERVALIRWAAGLGAGAAGGGGGRAAASAPPSADG